MSVCSASPKVLKTTGDAEFGAVRPNSLKVFRRNGMRPALIGMEMFDDIVEVHDGFCPHRKFAADFLEGRPFFRGSTFHSVDTDDQAA